MRAAAGWALQRLKCLAGGAIHNYVAAPKAAVRTTGPLVATSGRPTGAISPAPNSGAGTGTARGRRKFPFHPRSLHPLSSVSPPATHNDAEGFRRAIAAAAAATTVATRPAPSWVTPSRRALTATQSGMVRDFLDCTIAR